MDVLKQQRRAAIVAAVPAASTEMVDHYLNQSLPLSRIEFQQFVARLPQVFSDQTT
jgi:hypothetical protein